jgi:uncharacterized phage protein (TIGR01671 family)
MKEPKFRAWDKESEGMYPISLIDWDLKRVWLDGPTKKATNYGWQSFNKVILMQFTGLFDKNDKEGCKSDKISFGSTKTKPVYLIKWSVCNAGYYLESMDEQKEYLAINNLVVGEIIGNEYETSDEK